MRHGRFIRSLHEEVLIRRPDPGVPFGFELLSSFSCIVEQYRFHVNTDLTLNVQEKVFQVSVSPPNAVVQLDDHLIRLKFLSDITEPEAYYNQKENVLRVRNIESHPKAQLLEAVELGVLN